MFTIYTSLQFKMCDEWFADDMMNGSGVLMTFFLGIWVKLF